VRPLTADDRQQLAELHAREMLEYDSCCLYIEQRKLQMELIDVEHLLGGERIVFYFLAEKRVDFRNWSRTWRGNIKTRIELRQIGVRDEASCWPTMATAASPCAATAT